VYPGESKELWEENRRHVFYIGYHGNRLARRRVGDAAVVDGAGATTDLYTTQC